MANPNELMSAVVKGRASPKGRARSTKSGRHYTPKKTANYEGYLKHAFAAAYEKAGHKTPYEGPVRLDLAVAVPIPESWPRWKKIAAVMLRVMPTGTPDLDNYLKSVQDALNQVVLKDDAQIIIVGMAKFYSTNPSVAVQVCTMPGRFGNKVLKAAVDAWDKAVNRPSTS